MRLLADESINRLEVEKLRSRQHDLVWIEEETPGINDQMVLSRATSEGRVLLTSDKGHFGRLIFRDKQKTPFGIILFRVRRDNRSPSEVAQIIANAVENRSSWAGLFSTVRDQDDIRSVEVETSELDIDTD